MSKKKRGTKTTLEEMRRASLRKQDLQGFAAMSNRWIASRCCVAAAAPVVFDEWPGVVFLGCSRCGEPLFPVVGRIEKPPTAGVSRVDEDLNIVWDDGKVVVEEGSNPQALERW